MKKNIFLSLRTHLLVLCLVVLQGCGGGGGSSSTGGETINDPPTNEPPTDTTPDGFNFGVQTEALPATDVESLPATITGINAVTPIAITGGSYQLNGAAFTTLDGEVNNGDSLVVRVTSSDQPATSVTATVTVGGIRGDFVVTTLTEFDEIPDGLTFAAQDNVQPSTAIDSPAVAVSGINIPVPITITGGLYQLNDGLFTADAGVINDGDSLVVRVTSSDLPATSSTATVTIGPAGSSVSADLTVTTLPVFDTTPAAFSFAERVDVERNTTFEAEEIVISGINVPAPISITGGEYRIGAGDYTANAGTVVNGQTVTVLLTSSDSFNAAATARLTVGDISADFTVTTLPDVTAPTASVLFPPPKSLTEARTIVVRGSASDGNGSGVARVTVDDIAATTDDGYATWEVTLDLEQGNNTLVVETVDSLGNANSSAARIEIESSPYFFSLRNLTIDSSGNQLYAIDSTSRQVVRVNLSSGAITSITNRYNAEDPARDGVGVALALDEAGNRVLFFNRDGQLVAADLSTGERTIVASPYDTLDMAFEAYTTRAGSPVSASFDAANNRVVALDTNYDAIFAVGLSSGETTVLSSNLDEAANPFDGPVSMVADAANNRLLVADNRNDNIVSVDISTGARSVLLDNEGVESPLQFEGPSRLAFVSASNTLYIYDASVFVRRIIAVNLSDNSRTIFSEGGTQGFFSSPSFIHDAASNRLLMAEGKSIRTLSLGDSTEAELLSSHFPVRENPLINALNFAVDSTNDSVYVLDGYLRRNQGSHVGAAIKRIDVLNQRRDLLAGGYIGDSFTQPDGELLPFTIRNGIVVLDSNNNRLLLPHYPSSIISVDTESGEQAVFADGFDSSDPLFPDGTDVVVDNESNTAYFASTRTDSIITMNLDTGERGLLSSNTFPDASDPEAIRLANPAGIALDRANNRLLVLDAFTTSPRAVLMSVNLDTGERRVLASSDDNAGRRLARARDLAFDPETNTAYTIGQAGGDVVLAIDMDTANIRILSNNFADDPFNRLFEPKAVAFDAANSRLLVIDGTDLGGIAGASNTLLAIDPVNGQRVILSR
ncbi:hypothetical protein FKG94_25995 [Exilibacterium tricleocarpae]|uniref:YncE family protein n=1 Tax=Exilibacterium tricleocarpae TaxID=2591008 RepID=A0A545SQK5_9GAMM|nr:hypothetical protein [Exilibacterium tricleocarpae]TQV67248.1 hypothetical protein FKG94_25995 [Exilibacterium tricleocarpae]